MEKKSAVVTAMKDIVNTIARHDRPRLRAKALWLKQQDGEAWAIGEMVEKTCIMLDALNVGHQQES